ncbi:MAG: carboxypeptidase regulatory-like domain-containing protein [Bryobacterales bacterium]|nr:carboxypeptidase regulatory-like domain-containing protein [Bryobacterales bacterium]
MIRSVFSLLLVCSFVWAQDTAGVGAVEGVVSDAAGASAAGVEVCVADTGRCAQTGADGKFRIADLRPGSYVLALKSAGAAATSNAAVEVRAGLTAQVELKMAQLEAQRESVTVTASVFVEPEEIKSSSFLVTNEEVFKTAGALQDVSRYIQTLPGVVIGSDDFRNDIIVRGGSPLENLFIVDNVEIPNINAFANFASAGGTVGILDAALIQDTTFPHRRLSSALHQPHIERIAGDATRGQARRLRR